MRKALIGALLRFGGMSLHRGERLFVAAPQDEGWEDLVGSTLPRILGVSRIQVAISVGRKLRPNLKPVLQVSSPEGEVLAYVKVGWNALTRSLVEREADALDLYRAAAPRTFALPSVIYRGSWNDLEMTVVSPGPQRIFRRGRLYSLPDHGVVREITELPGGLDRTTVGGSVYWSELATRIRHVTSEFEDGGSVEWMAELVESQFGDVRLPFGSSHGDFTPWNMTRLDRPFIWDWERWTRNAPVGMDAIHFGFEVGVLKERMNVAASSRRAVERAAPILGSLGLGRVEIETVRVLQLVERAVRMEEGRRQGLSVDEQVVGGLSRELLEVRS
jgi:hypothetical protein